MPKPKLKLFIASTVYGFENELTQICAQLTTYGYEVINSHHRTVFADPNKSNLESCITAVEECDLFLGIITKSYGSGVLKPGEPSITHQEFKKAIEIRKPRWFIVDQDVAFARQLLKNIYYIYKSGRKGRKIKMDRKDFFDIRVIDIYNDALMINKKPSERIGHWVQEYNNLSDIMTFLDSQFKDLKKIKQIIKEMK